MKFIIHNEKTIQVGKFVFRSDTFEVVEDIGWAFSGGDKQFYYTKDEILFISMALHIMQQWGGGLVTTDGNVILATDIIQTSGGILNLDEVLMYDDKELTLAEILAK